MSRLQKIVIFGNTELAELANYYFRTDTEYKIVAFVVDDRYVKDATFMGLPVLALSELPSVYPPDEVEAFTAVGYSKLNLLRKEKYEDLKKKGYNLASYVSSKATILCDVSDIGDNAFILENNTIQPFVRIGSNVTLWSGNHVGHHSIIGNHSFITSHVVISGGVNVGDQCFIGVNATIRDHITIGDRSLIGAGALILRDTPESSIYISQATPRASVTQTSLS